jgi:type 1 glutamine amidotransferase
MKHTVLPALCCLVAMSAAALAADSPDKTAKPIRVLLTYGGHEFEQKPFYAMWDSLPGVQYTKAQLPQSADLLKPGLEKQYDVIVMYDMIKGFTPQQRQNFIDLLKTGIGVVSLHHNLCAHDDWPEYRTLIGGRYLQKPETIDGKDYPPSHYLHDQHMEVKIADREHPITHGVPDFTMDDEAYSGFYVSPDSHVLLTVDHPKCDHNVAWVTHSGNSRVFYLMFGHGPSAWQNPNYPKLLVQGIRWAAERNASPIRK